MYGFRRDPYGIDPLGPDYQKLMNPEPYLDTMQFTQNPNTPMTPPSMGIAEGGGIAPAPYMDYMMGRGQVGGGPNMAGGMVAAGNMAKSMANEEKSIGMPGVGRAAEGAAMKFIIPYAEQIAALQELRRMRR